MGIVGTSCSACECGTIDYRIISREEREGLGWEIPTTLNARPTLYFSSTSSSPG